LDGASVSYVHAVIESLVARNHNPEHITVPAWLHLVLVRLLIKPTWHELGPDGLSLVVWLLSRKPADIAIPESVLPAAFKPLLDLLLAQDRLTRRQIQIGPLRIMVTTQTLTPHIAHQETYAEVLAKEAPGVLQLLQLLVRYERQPSRVVYCNILRSIDEAGQNVLPGLRRHFRVPLPAVPWGSSFGAVIEQIAKMDDDAFADMIRDRMILLDGSERFMWDISFESTNSISVSTLLECYSLSPNLAFEVIFLLSRGSAFRFEATDTVDRFVEQIYPRLQADPSALVESPWCWSALLKSASTSRQSIRNLIITSCRKCLPYDRRQSHILPVSRTIDTTEMTETFGIFTEFGDPSVLPYIADAVLSQLRLSGGLGRHTASEAILPAALSTDLRKAQALLAAIAVDKTLCWSVRCSAALLQVLSLGLDTNAEPLTPVASELVAHCNSSSGDWLMEGVVTVLTFVGRRQTPAAAALVRDLFESCRQDYRARARLEQVLILWHEWSGAPVTTQGCRDRWLYRAV
jgi:hypothetical protein